MQKILVPTDFQLSSLYPLKTLLSQIEPDEKVEFTFVVGYYLPDSINELLFYNPQKVINKFINREFKEGLEIILNKYAGYDVSIKYEVFTGLNYNAFVNFVEAKNFDRAYVIDDYTMQFNDQYGMDFNNFLRRSSKLFDVRRIKLDQSTAQEGIVGLFFA